MHTAFSTVTPTSEALEIRRERLNSDGDPFLQPPSEHLEHVARLLDDARQMPLFMRR